MATQASPALPARSVVVMLWTGSQVVERLGPEDPDPTLEELDSIASAYVAWNDGVRPTVRVTATASGVGGVVGPAGTVPPRVVSP